MLAVNPGFILSLMRQGQNDIFRQSAKPVSFLPLYPTLLDKIRETAVGETCTSCAMSSIVTAFGVMIKCLPLFHQSAQMNLPQLIPASAWSIFPFMLMI